MKKNMSQKREKDETLELKVPTETPLSLSCPDNCKKIASSASNNSRPDMGRVDLGSPEMARPRSDREGAQDQVPETTSLKGRSETTTEEVSSVSVTTTPIKKAVNRCTGCGKRVGLTGFRCRCGDLFCAKHRYSDRHDCSYDYKTAGREAIARENPVVRAAKILKV